MNSTPTVLNVRLVRVGELPRGVDQAELDRLLRRQRQIRFYWGAPVEHEQLLTPDGGFYYTERELFPPLRRDDTDDLVVGITSLRIAPAREAAEPGGEYFGLWHNTQCPFPPEHARTGIISVTRWRERYEARAFRSTEQYIAYMLLAFIGDAELGGLTHPWCTGCVFDFNDDDESIMSSVKTASLCTRCRQHLSERRPELVPPFQRILEGVARPPIRAVLSYLQQNGLTSVFLFSVLLSLTLGFLQGIFATARHVALGLALVCGLVFVAAVWYHHRFPSGDLR